MEYLEREDEFDIHPISVIHKRRLDLEDEDVDVLTVEPVKGGDWDPAGQRSGSRDAGPSGSFQMPVLLDISESESEEDIVTVGPGTMRRKSPGAGKEWADAEAVGSGEEDKGPGKKAATSTGTSKRSRKRCRRAAQDPPSDG